MKKLLNFLFYLVIVMGYFPNRFTINGTTIITIVSLLLSLPLILKNNRTINKYINSFVVFMVLWVTYSIISRFWAVDIESWISNNRYVLLGLNYTILATLNITDKKIIANTFYITICSLTLHLVIGCFEVTFNQYLFTNNPIAINTYGALNYPVSFFYNTNNYSTFIVLGTTLLMFYENYKEEKLIFKQLTKIFKIIIPFLTLVLIIFADARILLIVMMLLFLTKIFTMVQARAWKQFIKLLIAVGFVFLTLFLFGWFNELREILISDASGLARVRLTEVGLDLLFETNFRGVGTGNVAYYLSSNPQYYVGGIYALHNWWIEIAVTYGLIFFAVFIIYYFKVLKQSIINLNLGEINNRVETAILLIFIICSGVPSTLFNETWMWLFMSITIVMTFKKNNILNKKEESFENQTVV